MSKIVATAVFERHHNRAKDTVVLPPDHRRPLRWGFFDAMQALI